MDEIWLILNTLFVGYSFYAWKKYSDKEFLWLGVFGAVIVFLLISKLFLINFFSENVRTFLSTLIYYSWLPVFGGLISVMIKNTTTKYILFGILLVLATVVTYLLVIGIDGVHLKP